MKRAGGIVVLIGMIGGGVWTIDGHYAKAAEVAERFDKLQQSIITGQEEQAKRQTILERRALEAEKRLLEQQQFQFLEVQQKRKLTELETQRLKMLSEDIGKINGEIESLKKREQEQLLTIDVKK